MRLTQILNVYKRLHHIKGTLYRGKEKIVPRVTHARKVVAVKDILNGARNEVILDKPFLLQEEEHGAMAELKPKQQKRDKMIAKRAQERWDKNRPHRTIEEHLDALNAVRKWE